MRAVLFASLISACWGTRLKPLMGHGDLYSRQASIQATDPFNHSWVDSFISIGDSFASGLGAGHAVKAAPKVLTLSPLHNIYAYKPKLVPNTDCTQYSFGYANLLNADGMMGENPDRVFQYPGCAGAEINDIKDKQVPKIQGIPQVVTISAGGNDANLVNIINNCIFQWFTFPLFSNCDTTISVGQELADAPKLSDDLKSLLSAVHLKIAGERTNRIYWGGI
ncbi:hypothetical protein EJ08DRAFT_42103 [Tothia fuscella]|uniref:SGNH hydrolase-type esterase domain-containing protein n=1 Tax=Tothia fuscella TaxID=1048955 RepID=A0A9P4NYA8_9PEZI|nr:hypothetical protein EJ08DRAFT_42103 [Tothia fuscella]